MTITVLNPIDAPTSANPASSCNTPLPGPDGDEPYVLFEVVHVEPTDHLDHDPLLQLSLSLLQEPGQPGALLIALAEEQQR